MRIKLFLVLIYLSLAILPTLNAKTLDPVTGQEWLTMSKEEKGAYMFSAMEVLKEHGVPLGKTPDQYIVLIGSEIADSPDALQAYVTNILALVVYEKEPGSRTAIDKINISQTASQDGGQ